MADEIQYGCGLRIIKDSHYVDRLYQPNVVTTDMHGSRGPYPGSLLVTTSGVIVNLEAVLQYLGGMCWMINKGDHLVVAGPYDPQNGRFFAYQDLLPNEPQVIRLSRYLAAEFVGTGTG